jgi:hypothetical protein
MAWRVTVDWTERAEKVYPALCCRTTANTLEAIAGVAVGTQRTAGGRGESVCGDRPAQPRALAGMIPAEGMDAVVAQVLGHGAQGQTSRLTAEQQLLAEVRRGRSRTFEEARRGVERPSA